MIYFSNNPLHKLGAPSPALTRHILAPKMEMDSDPEPGALEIAPSSKKFPDSKTVMTKLKIFNCVDCSLKFMLESEYQAHLVSQYYKNFVYIRK